MATLQEIDKAIGAHVMWKTRLKAAVETGRMEAPQAALTAAHDCPFGKWMKGPTIAPSTRTSAYYSRVDELHTKFHLAAARIGEMAIAGQSDQAIEEITGASEFSSAHKELAAAMEEWKKALR